MLYPFQKTEGDKQGSHIQIMSTCIAVSLHRQSPK